MVYGCILLDISPDRCFIRHDRMITIAIGMIGTITTGVIGIMTIEAPAP